MDSHAIDSFANSIIEGFADNIDITNFVVENIEIIVDVIAENNILSVTNTPGGPAVMLGYIAGQTDPIAQYNLHSIITYLWSLHSRNAFDSQEVLKEHFSAYMQVLSRYADTALGNVGLANNVWGSLGERMENAHDSSVNISYKRSYEAILRKNEKSPAKYRVANIRSYYFERYQNAVVSMFGCTQVKEECKQLVKQYKKDRAAVEAAIAKSNGESGHMSVETLNKYCEHLGRAVDELDKCAKLIPQLQEEMDTSQKIVKVIKYVETHNEYMVSVNSREVDVLLEVWKRIHDDINEKNRDILLGLFTDEMLTLIVPHRDAGIECVNGRIGAMIASLEKYDHDDLVDIKSVPVLRVNIVQHRAPKIIAEFLSRMNPKLVRSYQNGDESTDIEHMVNNMKRYVVDNINKEFGHLLSPYHLHMFIDEICREL